MSTVNNFCKDIFKKSGKVGFSVWDFGLVYIKKKIGITFISGPVGDYGFG